jgi:hypothetical protein
LTVLQVSDLIPGVLHPTSFYRGFSAYFRGVAGFGGAGAPRYRICKRLKLALVRLFSLFAALSIAWLRTV